MEKGYLERDKHLKQSNSTSFTGAINADVNAAAAQTHMDKFHASQGHGFAAEQANHLYDILTGQNAAIVGGDNVKDGADRLVNGINIQTKYCQDAAGSVAAAFDNGQYRYINPDGSLMQLEVPADQYEKAIELVARRIEKGQIPGITDPADAKEIVRRGHFTYDQAKCITEFGTVESLTFDSIQGAIISTSAFGITATLTFAQSLWNGDSPDIAVENAAYAGLQIGGISFANSVITAQLMRTGLRTAMTGPTNAVVNLLGPKASASIANTLRSGANIYGASAMNHVSKLLRGNILTSAVMTVVLSAKDIGNAFRGRISGKQLFKNIATTAGGLSGGTAGIFIGQFALNFIAPGAGAIAGFVVSTVGAAVGGAAGGSAVNAVVGSFIEDDAVALVATIEKSFCQLAQEYMLTEEEVEIVLEDLGHRLEGETLLDMFASPDHAAYADRFVRKLIERLIRGRCRVYLPTEAEWIQRIGRLLEDDNSCTCMRAESASRRVDPVEIGRELTGHKLSPHAARKGWYATKQINLAQVQAEERLKRIQAGERQLHQSMSEVHRERNELKRELSTLMGGTEE